MSKSPFNKKGKRAKETLELIHSDVCGPMSTYARGGYLYFVTLIDEYSRYGYVYLMSLNLRLLKSSKNLEPKWRNNLVRVSKH